MASAASKVGLILVVGAAFGLLATFWVIGRETGRRDASAHSVHLSTPTAHYVYETTDEQAPDGCVWIEPERDTPRAGGVLLQCGVSRMEGTRVVMGDGKVEEYHFVVKRTKTGTPTPAFDAFGRPVNPASSPTPSARRS